MMRPVRFLALLAAAAVVVVPAPDVAPAALAPPAVPTPAPAEPTSPPAEIATPVAGSTFDTDLALPAHAEDVADYTLRASLDPVAHTVHGEGTIAWKNTSAQPVREVWLHLYLNAFKNERSAFLRERVGGRGSGAPEDWGWIDVRKVVLHAGDAAPVDVWPGAELHRPGDDDETDARVPLPVEVQPGEQIHLDVTFDDKLPVVVERTGYRGSFHMVGQWFPKVARLEPDGTWAHFPFHHLAEFYADYGSYDVTLDVPEAYAIGATGPVADARVEAGRRVERHVQVDVHDFAWTAWDRWQAATETIDGVDVTLLYPRGFTRLAQRELATLRFALPYYSARYGRYPYAVLDGGAPAAGRGRGRRHGVPDPHHDGRLVADAGGDPPAGGSSRSTRWGTRWFYGLVGNNELAWPFLDEGLNQFAEQDGMAKWRGDGSAAALAGLTLSDAALDAVGSNMSVHDEPVAQAANAFTSGRNYGALVYGRTAAVMETLRRVYGDEPVLRALGRYARRFRFQHPGPEQLIAVFQEVLGTTVGATLWTALFEKGWVDYAVDGVWARRRRRGAAGVFDRDGGKREKGGSRQASDEGRLGRRRAGAQARDAVVPRGGRVPLLADGTPRAPALGRRGRREAAVVARVERGAGLHRRSG